MSENCGLCRVLKEERNLYLYEDADVVILPTKTMKGHHKRIMLLTKKHVKDLPKKVEDEFINRFIVFCKKYFDEEPTFALVESTYASIPEHWHRIACDWFGTEKEIQQLHYTPHQAIATYVRWKP